MKYNIDLIEKNIEAFKSHNYKPEDVTICFDMDNTLCLFSPFGNVNSAIKSMHSKGFYRKLYCFPEVSSVIESLKKIGFKVKIVSACIDSPYCESEKRDWIHYHIPSIEEEDIIFTKEGQNKADVITNPSSTILVDDYHKNIQDIYAAGAIGIKKTYSGKERPVPQVQSLIDIFPILYNLKCM